MKIKNGQEASGYLTLDSIAPAGFGIETNSFDNPDNIFRTMALRSQSIHNLALLLWLVIRSSFH